MKLDVQSDLEHWRALMVNRYRCRDASQVSPLVIISYLTYAPIYDNLIELDRFVLVVLYEERGGGYLPVIRFAGYGGGVQAGIAQLGGHEHCRFFKDVALKPQKLAHGARLNLRHPSLLRLALRMESRWQSEMRHLHRPRQSELPLPRLWAAFRTADVERLRLDHSAGRPHHNMQLFPIETVQPHLREAMTGYVDLAQWPTLQCIQADDVRTGLAGSRGAIAFDFYGSHFRGRCFRDRRRPQVPATRAERPCRLIHAG